MRFYQKDMLYKENGKKNRYKWMRNDLLINEFTLIHILISYNLITNKELTIKHTHELGKYNLLAFEISYGSIKMIN